MKNLFILFFLTNLLVQEGVLAGGGPVTSNRFDNSLVGGQGSTGSLIASYGQLELASTHAITFDEADAWVAIPFDTFALSSNMSGSTTSPATITIEDAGIYQMNITIYFSSEDSPEGPFTATTYTIGTRINSGGTIAKTAVYAAAAGYLTLSYNTLAEFSAGDTIQFYIKTSATGGGSIFDNVVTLVSGNANLVQIAD